MSTPGDQGSPPDVGNVRRSQCSAKSVEQGNGLFGIVRNENSDNLFSLFQPFSGTRS